MHTVKLTSLLCLSCSCSPVSTLCTLYKQINKQTNKHQVNKHQLMILGKQVHLHCMVKCTCHVF